MSRRWLHALMTLAAVASSCIAGLGCASASFEEGVIGVEVPYFNGGDAAWSPDGEVIAIPVKDGIRLRNVNTDATELVAAPPLRGFPEPPGSVSWSANGRTLRYVTSIGPDEKKGSWLTEVNRDGSGLRQVPLGIKVSETAWARQGWPLAFSTGYYAYDIEKGPLGPNPALLVVPRFGAEPKTIVRVGPEAKEATIEEPEFSPDGKRILYRRSARRTVSIWTVRPDGSDPRRLVPALVSASSATWSPSGNKIAYAGVGTGNDRRYRLRVLPATGGKPRQISDQEILDGPTWSPDGRWLTFSNYEGEIRRVHPDGSGEEVIAELPGEEVRGLLWSPDGEHLAYMARTFPESD